MDRFTNTLIATTLSTYLPVVLGAMTAATDGFGLFAIGHARPTAVQAVRISASDPSASASR